MKLIIDIPNYDLNLINNGSIACSQILRAVKKGIPYEERPHGEWIPVDEIGNVVRCSQCSFRTCADVAEEEYNFCPNCGASMIKKEGDAE